MRTRAALPLLVLLATAACGHAGEPAIPLGEFGDRLEIALIACVASIGFFHAALSLTRPAREVRLFAAAALLLAARMCVLEGHVPDSFALGPEALVRIEFFTLGLIPAVCYALVCELFPGAVPQILRRGVYAVSGAAMAASLALSRSSLPGAASAFLAAAVLATGVTVAVTAKATIEKRPGAFFLLLAFLLVLAVIAFDGTLVPAASAATAFAFAVVLGHRLNAALAESDRLAVRLRDANVLLEQKVAERTIELERVAMTDPLTGLWNRRSLLMLAEIERARTERTKEKLGVMMIDCDDFKIVNDLHGHDAGDQVLLGLAQRFQALVRPTDLLARWGGEEFVMVFSTNTVAGAKSAADRMRHKVAGLPFDVSADVSLGLTVSIGVAVLEDSFESFEDLLRRADRALYWAKAAGKNKVKLDEAAD